MEKPVNQLFEAFKNGDREAFCELYRLYYNRLLRIGNLVTNDRELVENTIQDFFVHMLKHPEKLSRVENFELYIFKAIRQNILAELVKLNRRSAILQQAADNTDAFFSEDLFPPDTSEPSRVKWLKKQIGLLPSRQQEFIYLRFFEGFSYDKIAQLTSVTNQVARNYVARAIKKLRKKGDKFISN